jgi:formylglycine-generating enzyme required for sulfatase activity
VKLSAYCIAETEVTQALWTAVMGDNPSHHKGNDQFPVENVSWDDCQKFIKKLNALHLIQGTFSLPTEAQWEYAARGASITLVEQYAGSDNLDEVGWYKVNSNDSTHAVAQKQPNELGLYDMSGNVSEFCSDWYANSYSNMSVTDPTGPTSGTLGKVYRGGFFSASDSAWLSVFHRNHGLETSSYIFRGLRLVCTPF